MELRKTNTKPPQKNPHSLKSPHPLFHPSNNAKIPILKVCICLEEKNKYNNMKHSSQNT
jgi:hypothetical protein